MATGQRLGLAARQSRWEPASIRMRLRCRCC